MKNGKIVGADKGDAVLGDDGNPRNMKSAFDYDYGPFKEYEGGYWQKDLVKNLGYNKGKDSYFHYTFDFIQLNLRSKTSDKEYTNWINAHSGTNTHQGLYEGLNMLFEASEKRRS